MVMQTGSGCLLAPLSIACQLQRMGRARVGQYSAQKSLYSRQIPDGDSFLTADNFEEFRAVLGHLRHECPPAMPVVVRTSQMPPTLAGECRVRPNRFVIRLSDTMSQEEAIQTLVHEWAHALAWNYTLDRLMVSPGMTDEVFQLACHDEAWGCAYSRVWRAYLVANENKEVP